MRISAALFPVVLAFGAIILAPGADARAPTMIRACGTISQPGSYELANNLTATGNCLVITADFVTIDLAGFSISGSPAQGLGISAGAPNLRGIAIRNGSISGFVAGISLVSSRGSIVEGLRVFDNFEGGIVGASGIVRNNIVVNTANGTGISADGTVTGNYVADGFETGMFIGAGSTVIGNTVVNHGDSGIVVTCPANLTDNTATGNRGSEGGANLVLNGQGCHNEDNVAP
jgi:hypothetical protein